MGDRFTGGLLGPITYGKSGGSVNTAQIRHPNGTVMIAANSKDNNTHLSPNYDFGANLGTSTPAEEGGRVNEISFKVLPNQQKLNSDNWAALIFGLNSSGRYAGVNKSSGIGFLLQNSGGYQIFNGSSKIATGSVTPGSDGFIDVRVQYTIPADSSAASQIQIYFNDELIQEISKTLPGNYFQFQGYNAGGDYTHHLYKDLVVKSSANYNYDVSNADVFALDKNWTTNGLDKRDVIFLSDRDGETEAEHVGSITLGANTNINVASGLSLTQSGAITGQYTLTKTGAGTLLINAAQGAVDIQSLVVSSGRLDMKEYFKGALEIEDGATFSPGNSIGTLNQTGNFTLDSGATLLIEIGGTDASENDQLIVSGTTTFEEGSIIQFALYPDYTPSLGETIEVTMPEVDWSKATFSSNYFTYRGYENGNVILGVNPNAVPEPSTWALLVLGTVGLFWLRRKNGSKNAA